MIITLSSRQVVNYIISCFYRPSIIPNMMVADKYKRDIINLDKNGMISGWEYDTDEDNRPTLADIVVWEHTPQDFFYWSKLHTTIENNQGYDDKKIQLFFTHEQLKGKSSSLAEDPDETREII